MTELFPQAMDVMKEKDKSKKIALLNTTLEYLLTSAAETGVLDISPFIVGCFVASPNDEQGTAAIIKATQLFQRLPELKTTQKFHQLFAERELHKVTIKVGEVYKEITIKLNLQLLVEIGQKFHDQFNAGELNLRTVYQSANTVIDLI